MVEMSHTPPPDEAREPAGETSSSQVERVRIEPSREGIRVRLLIALPVMLILIITLFGGLIYQIVIWQFSGIVPEIYISSFAREWLAVLAGFIFLSALVGFYVAWSVTMPIRRIISVSAKVAEGDFSVKAALPTAEASEMGALTQSFDQMIESLNRFIAMRNRIILESFTGGLLTTDMHGTVTAVNSAAEKTLSISAAEAIGKPAVNILRSPSLDAFRKVVEEALWKREPIVTRRVEIDGPSGQQRLSVNTNYMRDETGRIFGLIVNFRNLSELEHFYEQMNRTERLATLGTFSAGLAHEIRNPLGSIKGITQLLAEDLRDNPTSLEYTRIIIREADRLDELVREVQEYAQPVSTSPEPADLNQVVRETLLLARNNPKATMQDGVTMTEEYAELPAALISADRIRQALLNLVVNAIQATPPGGKIRVKTAFVADESLPLRVVVSNTGSSIAPENLQRIFEPFFTTKDQGSGLGLAVAYQIMRHHGGDIVAENDPDGVTFTIRLPIKTLEEDKGA